MLKNSFYFIVIVALFLGSCSDFNKIQKSNDIAKKLEAGIEYYKKKDYYKASTLLDEIVPLLKGRAEAEDAQYYQALTYYEDKQYVMSAYYLKDFYETYPRSPKAEEANFLHTKSLYKDSPRHDLDQTTTIEAVRALQEFANKYPKSQYLVEVNTIADELNKKLELKDYENSKLYFKIKNYKSAIVAFTSFLERYPASVYVEEISFLRINAQYQLSRLSVEGIKKKTRYSDVIEYYHDFIDRFPSSQYKKEAEQFYENSNKFLTNQVKA